MPPKKKKKSKATPGANGTTRDSEAGDGAISKVFGGETFGLGDPDGGDAHAGASAP